MFCECVEVYRGHKPKSTISRLKLKYKLLTRRREEAVGIMGIYNEAVKENKVTWKVDIWKQGEEHYIEKRNQAKFLTKRRNEEAR